ncbi:hypothetical protein HOLleu_40532 [Holothuria leucospilota]|uniref:Uncharacterized protein n=1 Tax=Holothuria leucospilota TaxID=206669 RepID=A0A9Q0YHV2_HOLLE|nr:hypothetical protein HOLleu_40532 [Holothuria leucospilota]
MSVSSNQITGKKEVRRTMQLHKKLRLTACYTSGNHYVSEEFRHGQPKLSSQLRDRAPESSMQYTYQDGYYFVAKEALICCMPL